ncbi:hypothetical protein [Lyticum sinuosum]|uniref:Uncharacterized protein n=1 Tax=Lyticum sinuosum TaxID=1332059 RepID=A0AAE5AHS6_9RICK|nr:hypothetical protein [Lyticum sinuosum]MDZ5761493.1 hypothetical protein [Lyticum sinuosum]
MIQEQIFNDVGYDPDIINAISSVPREIFLPENLHPIAYSDRDFFPYIPSIKNTAIFCFYIRKYTEENLKILENINNIAIMSCSKGYLLHVLAHLKLNSIGITESPDDINRGIEILEIIKNNNLKSESIYKNIKISFSNKLQQKPYSIIVYQNPIMSGYEEKTVDDIIIRNLIDNRGICIYILYEKNIGKIISSTKNGTNITKEVIKSFAICNKI